MLINVVIGCVSPESPSSLKIASTKPFRFASRNNFISGHSIMPSNVNYRANLWALKNLGCTHILASTLCGSLQENIKPGDIVIIDGFVDRTTKRNQTFYDGKEKSPVGVCHIPMEPAFCTRTRDVIIHTAMQLGKIFLLIADIVVLNHIYFYHQAFQFTTKVLLSQLKVLDFQANQKV